METEEIAIIGAGCRFPGADNLEEFWRVLVNAENHVKEIPLERWNNEAFYDEDKNAKGKSYVRRAGLLNSYDKWDNRLFDISDNEASQVDPQQRYVLECVHMALEDAGITRAQVNGSNTGVMIGCMNEDYKVMLNLEPNDFTSYSATGMSASVISARVAYVYNLHGTCLTLDTACSSALVAMHLASQALKTGDCEAVICGGVSSIINPDTFVPLCKAKMMSTVGQCQTFCDTADGYARGEGCGIVILKRLSDAIRDGNKIWATIKTGSNQDGCVVRPITAPSGQQQGRLLKHMYKTHGIDPATIQYIEAHGTGTPKGDPTEINALGEFFASHRAGSQMSKPLLIGSVKSNIGHTESAAGVAGLLKVLLMMKNGKIVPSLHVKPDKSNINKKIRLEEFRLDIAQQVDDWREVDGERIACLNSFGFGGSNGHAVIKQWTRSIPTDRETNVDEDKIVPICMSAIDGESLKQNLEGFLSDMKRSDIQIKDISYTSLNHRDIFSYRTLLFGKDRQEVIDAIKNKLPKVKDVKPSKRRNVVFVFCGVGTTWKGMCQELMVKNDVFRKTIEAIDGFLYPLAGWKIGDKLSSVTNYDDPFLSHIAIFSVQVALSSMWRAFGIEPDVIVGQSVGEVAAACVAELLTLEEAVKVIYHRSKILAKQSVGTMMVIGNMDISQIEAHCRNLQDKVTVAVYSSPRACTLSGHESDLKELKGQIEAEAAKDKKSVLVRELGVKCAYHSKLVEPCTDEIRSTIDGIFEESTQDKHNLHQEGKKAPFISTVTGHTARAEEVRTGKYWANNVRMPVKFMHGISTSVMDDGMNVFLEIGPRPVLRAHLPAIMGDQTNAIILPSILANKELSRVYATVSELFELGLDLNLERLATPRQSSRISDFPRYVFKRSTELFLPEKLKLYISGVRNTGTNSHMFVRSSPGTNSTNFEIQINAKNTPFVYEHFLSGSILVPGATYVETGFEVGFNMFKKPVNQMSVKVEFMNTFTPVPDRDYKLLVETTPADNERISFLVKNEERKLATGQVAYRISSARPSVDIDQIRSRLPRRISGKEVYKLLGDLNFRYGPSLSLIQCAFSSDKECLAEIHFSEDRTEELTSTRFHPAIVDAVFQMFGILDRKRQFTVPKGVDSITLTAPLEHKMYCYVKEIKSTSTSSHCNALLLSSSGCTIAEFSNFYTKTVSGSADENRETLQLNLHWVEVTGSGFTRNDSDKGRTVVFSQSTGAPWLNKLRSIESTDLISDVTESVVSQILDNGECDAVVYHVGPSDQNHGQGVFNSAVKHFMNVKLILSGLSTRKSEIQFTVVTENTQPVTGRDVTNISGSELWGMLRAVFQEGHHAHCRLVDIDRENPHVPTLANMFKNKSEKKECVLIGSKVYESRVAANANTVSSRRQMNTSMRDRMCLYSAVAGGVEQPFFGKEENNYSTETKHSEMVQISLNITVLHDSTVYLSTLQVPSKDDIWQDAEQTTGYQILTVEGQGKLVQKEKENGGEVIFCYPVSTATTVYVPPECVINRKECLLYRNGLILEMNLLLNMIITLPCPSEVILITEYDNNSICSRFCEEVAKGRGMTITTCRHRDLRRRPTVNRGVNVVLASKVTPPVLEAIFQKYRCVQELVSIQALFPDDIHLWTNVKYPDTTIQVLKSGFMFDPKNLVKTVPEIRRFLQTVKQRNMGSIVFSSPMKELNIRQMFQQRNARFLVERDNLFSLRGCYVLIGGLTGLGWELLKLLAELGAGYLIPMSRRKPTTSQTEQISSVMKKYGCHVIPQQVDISDYSSVKRVFEETSTILNGIPIRGIFHGAGTLADTLLMNQDEDKVRMVLTPKVLGTWNLHQVSHNLPLDYFVMHSSIVSVIGNHGQCNYAAGNSFMDSFASYRRSVGLAAQSLNWGALAVGMAADNPDVEMALRSRGFRSLNTDTIKRLFIDALMNNETNVILADIDWDFVTSSPSFLDQRAKYESLVSSVKQAKPKDSQDATIDCTKIMELEPAKRREQILIILKTIINDVFVVDESTVTPNTSLVALGVDSMQAMSFSNKLVDMFACQIPLVSLLSEQTTLTIIAESVIAKLQTVNVDTTNVEVKATEQKPESNDADLDMEYLFGNEDITFMQIGILEKNRYKKTDPSQVRISDALLGNIRLDVAVWKDVLHHVLKINPELRKVYSFAENDKIKVNIVPAADAQPDVMKVDFYSLVSSDPYEMKEDITFDLEKDFPIRIRIGENESGTLFRIILHGLVADMTSTAAICKDIELTAAFYTDGKELPGQKPVTSISNAVRDAIQPKMYDLHAFWSSYLSVPITPVSIGFPISTPDEEFYEQISHLVPSGIVQRIQKYIGQKGISLYNFVLSIYQLYLHMETGAEYIPIGTAVNMRYHVPDLSKAVTRCTNYVPVVAEINPSQTIHSFIQANSENIGKTTKHAAYPSLLFKQKILRDRDPQVKENIFRHNIVMNDVSALNGLEQATKMKPVQSKMNYETFMRVKYDLKKQWIELDIGYNSEILGFEKGERFPRELVDLMEKSLVDGHKTIAEIYEEREETQDCPTYEDVINEQREENVVVDQQPVERDVVIVNVPNGVHMNGHGPNRDRNVLIEGEFLKQTTQGWDHRVACRLVENQIQDRLVLEWRSSKKRWNGKERSLDIREMLQIKLLTLNGLSGIMMKMPKRWYVLKTPNHNQAQQWLTEITMAMQK